MTGVLLSLHRAQAAVDDPRFCGCLLEAACRPVRPPTPPVSTVDLNANITRRVVGGARLLDGCHILSQVDHVSCGQRAAHGAETSLRHDNASFYLNPQRTPILLRVDRAKTVPAEAAAPSKSDMPISRCMSTT